mmetsp:Transcript_42288/g.106665  ORF Transcript_42288/g.106665 Transcript_42288/m.106665 type:complete len:270 (-) Transcript_42288:78-887(-)|eukprot:CAMPEP_0177631252 /NCGR_PEP_ID=MMETSP0447-20121125/1647_1 /TAXON_ID=0 /ORGANISM="Stygamoeba regulata, Strain BSH-02190019" /LENGTH=269 /DNA_ID=CAMNT_0019132717 /DNA_START=34 /DNA_END=843 /DNA_ORIENTATION=-
MADPPKVLEFTEEDIDITKGLSNADFLQSNGEWEVILEQGEEATIARQFMEEHSIYRYYTQGRFADCSAERLCAVLTDLEYKRDWDDLCGSTFVIECALLDGSDATGGRALPTPESTESTDARSCTDATASRHELIYAEVKFPWPLTNRDYVYARRVLGLDAHGAVQRHSEGKAAHSFAILSGACTHEAHPESSKAVRVLLFRSWILVRPSASGGAEYFSLYYDDPRGYIPKSAVNWAIRKAIPKAIQSLKDSCVQYAVWKQAKQGEKS